MSQEPEAPGADPRRLQLESYHETGAPNVETMASSERVVFSSGEHPDGDGTLRTALEQWSVQNGPVMYNAWQSVFFQLRRNKDLVDEDEVPREVLSGKQVRILRLYNEIQGVVHGANHRAQAASRKQEASAGQQGHATRPGRVAVPSDLPGQVSAARPGLAALGPAWPHDRV